MTPLEKLGLEVAAYQLLGSRMQASILCALLLAGGRVLSPQQLADVHPWKRRELTYDSSVIRVHIHRLRKRLEDLGLGRAIYNARLEGYAIHPSDRERVMARLVEEAS